MVNCDSRTFGGNDSYEDGSGGCDSGNNGYDV